MRPRRVMQTGWFGVNTPTLTPTISGSRSVAWLLTSVKLTVLWNCCHMQSLLSLFDCSTQLRPIFILVLYFQCQLTNIRDMGHGWFWTWDLDMGFGHGFWIWVLDMGHGWFCTSSVSWQISETWAMAEQHVSLLVEKSIIALLSESEAPMNFLCPTLLITQSELWWSLIADCQVAYLADADGFHVDASNLPVANVVSQVIWYKSNQQRKTIFILTCVWSWSVDLAAMCITEWILNTEQF